MIHPQVQTGRNELGHDVLCYKLYIEKNNIRWYGRMNKCNGIKKRKQIRAALIDPKKYKIKAPPNQ
jgi:hypothetical protein